MTQAGFHHQTVLVERYRLRGRTHHTYECVHCGEHFSIPDPPQSRACPGAYPDELDPALAALSRAAQRAGRTADRIARQERQAAHLLHGDRSGTVTPAPTRPPVARAA